VGFARGGGVVGIRVQVRCGGLVVVVRKKFGGLGPSVLRVWCCGCDCHALIVAVLPALLYVSDEACATGLHRDLSQRASLCQSVRFPTCLSLMFMHLTYLVLKHLQPGDCPV